MLTQTKNHLQEMLELSLEYDGHKHDHSSSVKSIKFDPVARMILPNDVELFQSAVVQPLAPTEWAWNQLFNKLGYTVWGKGSSKKLPADYLLHIPEDLLAESLNRHLQNAGDESWFVRAYDDTARAVMSDKYAVISNTEMLDLLVQTVDKQETPDFKLIRPFVSPDTLHAKMVWKETNRDDGRGGNYGIGVYVRNGEIGNLSVSVYPMIQRSSCTNSIILDEEAGVKFRHFGNVSSKRVQIQSTMIEMFPHAAELLNKMIEAEEQRIPNFNDVLMGLSDTYGWDEKTRMTVATGTEGSHTRAGLVNGISYAAHEIHREDHDQMTEMEILSGRILVAPDSVFAKAEAVARNLA